MTDLPTTNPNPIAGEARATDARVSGAAVASDDINRLRDLSPEQWKSGIAAWLGWLFDGLDIHLYTLVATPFVAELLGRGVRDDLVTNTSSVIQGAFLVGWAVGGGFFGWIGDRIGRTRALMFTILTYSLFTGMSFFAQTWWQLLIFRFLTALGIGGEWAVGASLLSETWPRRWRPWVAAVLQGGVNLGVLLAMLAGYLLSDLPYRTVFLVGVLPALLVVWIRRAVPESKQWHAAKLQGGNAPPGVSDLFRGSVRRVTVRVSVVCGLSLTAHWAFMFWCFQHLRNLTDVSTWSDAEKTQLISQTLALVMAAAIVGNFLAAWIAQRIGYRKTIASLCIAYFLAMFLGYCVPRGLGSMWWFLAAIGLCQGLFAPFSMYLPPLFPTLLRTTGAGFCFNVGRIVAAVGTVFFGLFSKVGDYRLTLLYASFLFLPAAAVALVLPEPPDERSSLTPLE